MRIVILSGKGGTGKSCVTSALASVLESVVLVDADVDCPNQHLLFRGEETSRRPFSASKVAVIGNNNPMEKDYLGTCQFGAIKREGSTIQIDETRCEGCGACAIAFPELKIILKPKESGDIIVKETGRFPLVYGKLVPGESGSGRIVFEIKKVAERIAAKNNAAVTLIDAPAGIGCPVIAAVTGCDYAVGIVEPTPASIANLERALKVVDHFRIPFSVIMNKVGISENYEERIRGMFGERLAGEVPYDEEIPHLLAEGIPPVKGKGEAARKLRELGTAIEEEVAST
jgi:MinD superfamily P-loop ATPase